MKNVTNSVVGVKMSIENAEEYSMDFNDEFNNVMDEMYDFYIFGRDYYLSLREQFTADLIRDYVNDEQVILEGTFTDTIKKIIDGIIKFIKTMWRKFIGLFTKSSKNIRNKIKSDANKNSERRNDDAESSPENTANYTLNAYDYINIINNEQWLKTSKMIADIIVYFKLEADDIGTDIHNIILKRTSRPSKEDYSDPIKNMENDIQKYHMEHVKKITDTFNVDDINNISTKDIRDYIFKNVKKSRVSKTHFVENYKDLEDGLNKTEKRVQKAEKSLNDLIDTLNRVKSNVEKNSKTLDVYKTGKNEYHDSDERMQKLIIDFLKFVQKNANDSMTFCSKVIQVQLSIINEGITFINNL